MNNAAMLNRSYELASLVQALVDHTSSVIYVKDLEFRYLLINKQFETLFHVSREEILGKNDFDIFPAELAEAFRVNDRHVLESGEPLNCEEIASHDDGHHRYWSLKFPLRDGQNSIYALAGISTDITDRLRDQHEIASLQDRHQMILDSVGDGICGLDDSGHVVFLNPAGERILQWTTAELQGKCHSQVVLNHRNSSRVSDALPLDQVASVIGGQSTIRVQSAVFRRRDGSLVPVEFTVAPIREKGAHVKAVIAFRDTTERLKHIAIEQEVLTARRIQISLNPKEHPKFPGFDFAAMSTPCSKACGDYYDFIPWGRNHLGIVVGDVSGHGLGAALEMVETRAILRATMLIETDPVECLSRLNLLLTEDLPDDMFVTLFLMSLNTQDRTFTYASAGHDGLLLRASGEVIRLESTGTVLGWKHSAKFLSGGTVQLASGDIVVIATDGISETLSPTRALYGRNRLIELIQRYRSYSAGEILDVIRASVDSFREHEPQRDDVTAIVIKVL